MLRFLKPKKSKPTRLPAAQGVEEGTNPCQSLRASSPTALPEDIDLRPLKHTPSTALNGLKFALAGLGAASSGLPLPGLASTANSVLVVLNKLEVRLSSSFAEARV